MDSKHQLVINVIDHKNNQVEVGHVLPKDCNYYTAITALRTIEIELRDRMDKYAQARGYASAKEMPFNFREKLTIGDITPAEPEVKKEG